MKCKVCEKTIRGNAASEDYNENTQTYTYTCKVCDELFYSMALYPNRIEHHEKASALKRQQQPRRQP